MIKKVLLSSINYDHFQAGLVQGFKNVFGDGSVAHFDYLELGRQQKSQAEINAAFLAQAQSFKPDWIFMQLQDTNVITPDAIAAIRRSLPKCVVTHWTGDCRAQVSAYLSSICAATHLTFVSSVGQLPLFKAAGAPEAHYCQIGLDWDEDVMGLPPWTPPFPIPDVVFCGGYYESVFPGTVDRVLAIRTLQGAGISIGIVGGGWPKGYPVIGSCGVKQQYHVWTRAKVSLNVNHFNDIERYYSDRQIISMASGTPLVCRYVPGLEKEFVDGEHCLFYKTPEELVRNVKTLLSNEHLAIAVGAAGRAEVMKNHTWERRIEEIFPHVGRTAQALGV